MTPDEFRQIALGFPGAVESALKSHPDFRLNGKVFATLGYPDERWAMVRLTPEQQRTFTRRAPDVFGVCRGTSGKRGATNVHLESAKTPILNHALASAFGNIGGVPAEENS